MPFRTLDNLDVAGKRVLLRADLNVPVRDGKITDLTRIERLSPTIRELAGKGAKVIVCSHFDRPKGKRVPEMSLAPMAAALGEVLGQRVRFAEDCVGVAAQQAVERMARGDVLVLENTRYHAEEEKNDPGFAAELAKLADIYVNDAFSAAHRAHASTEGVAHLLPAYAGRLMQAELEALDAALGNPVRPGRGDRRRRQGLHQAGIARQPAGQGGRAGDRRRHGQHLPGSAGRGGRQVAAGSRAARHRARHPGAGQGADAARSSCRSMRWWRPNSSRTCRPAQWPSTDVPADAMILDVGPATVADLIATAGRTLKTLVWNGPLGAFETPPFDAATTAIARAVAAATQSGALRSVAGGGDTVSALRHAGVLDKMSYVSSAGGAFLEWLEGKTLPGVAALS